MSHVREARLFKILLQMCALWDIDTPKGWKERLYEFYKLALQVIILIFLGIIVYMMLFLDASSVGDLLGNYLPWFHGMAVFFISWVGLFLAMPTLQKLLALKCEAAPFFRETVLRQQRRSYKRFIFLHGKLTPY